MAHVHAGADGASTPRKALRTALILTGGFCIVELLGGWLANSLALLADAGHMLTDTAALGLSFLAAWMASWPTTPKMSFGYQRAEILVALASGLLIWFLTGILIFEAVGRLSDPPEVSGGPVVLVAFLGMLINIACLKVLGGHQNLNIRAARLHVLGDFLGSIAALASGVLIYWKGWTIVDPILSFVIAALLLYGSWKLIREAIPVLMESAPRGILPQEVQKDLESLTAVQEVHDLHIWSVTSGKPALSVHLVSLDSAKALQMACEVLEKKYGIHHTTIQIEDPAHFDSTRCVDCG